MAGKRYSVDQLAAATVRQAQRDVAAMQADLNRLRDGVAGLTGAIHAPVIRSTRTRTKRTVSSPSILDDLAAFGAGAILSGAGFGGYSSVAQKAGNSLADLALGQRIR